jgi:hypothetical protein
LSYESHAILSDNNPVLCIEQLAITAIYCHGVLSHPARDAHDTFFMKEPMLTNRVPDAYYETVKATHEKGECRWIGLIHVFSLYIIHIPFAVRLHIRTLMIHYKMTT